MQPITVLGLRAMGSALASALAGAGYATTMWNRLPDNADTEHALTHDALRRACTTAIEHLAVADRIYPGRDPATYEGDMPGAIIIGAGPGIGTSVAKRVAREGLATTVLARTPATVKTVLHYPG